MLINKIYPALEGEGIAIGIPQIFVRTQGCKVGCRNCDSKQTWKYKNAGTDMSPQEILQELIKYDVDRVSLTGGNPLEQPDLVDLIELLKRRGYFVNVETTGTDYAEYIFSIVDQISMDCKTPGTGVKFDIQIVEDSLTLMHQIGDQHKLQLKCVVSIQDDLDFVIDTYNKLRAKGLLLDYQMVITPCFEPKKQDNFDFPFIDHIYQTIMKNNYKIRVILQQHKVVYGAEREDV